MQRFGVYALLALGALFTALPSCNEQFDESYVQNESIEKEKKQMPAVGYTTITALDYGGPLPVTALDVPDDGTEIIASDIRTYEAAFLAQAKYDRQQQNVEYVYEDVPAPSLAPVILAPNSITGNTWQDTSIKIDVADCKVGDDIKVRVWGSWQLNAASNITTVGRVRVAFYLDPLGGPLLVPNVLGYATISDDSGALTLPHNENYLLEYRYRVAAPLPTNPVTVRAVVQARSEDLSGGAGTATMIFVHSARMDLTHTKRN